VIGAMVRGLVVGIGVFLVTLLLVPGPFTLLHPVWAIAFAVLGSGILASLGVIAGIWADKFDELAAFQNFLIMPLTFLSGVFYSIHSLPPFWQVVSHFNPFFYMIDGFRYGFFGLSDIAPGLSLLLVAVAAVVLAGLALLILARGWKLRH
jgi:ABC-2 type transport system permease protein